VLHAGFKNVLEMQFVGKKKVFVPHLLTREQDGSGSMLAVDVAQCESTHKIEITQKNYFELA